jgi:hypothetical protein
VAEPRAGADDAGADRADHRVVALLLRPGERRGNGHELRVAVEAGRDSYGDLDQPALPKFPERVG